MRAIARWVSILGHPIAMVAIMVTAVSMRHGSSGQASRIVGIVLLLSAAPAALLMILQVRRGAWENVDASNPHERPTLLMTIALGLAALVIYFCLAHPQSFMMRGAVGTLAMLAACAISARWLKVSLHMAFATLATTTLVLLGSPIGWVLLPLLPVLAWSRLLLLRHRATEVVAGFLVGLVTGLAI